jgi:hypothetical protein
MKGDKSNPSRARLAYAASNLECARVIVANPGKYPPTSGLAQWAALVLAKRAQTIAFKAA